MNIYNFLPQQLLSRVVGSIAKTKLQWVKSMFIRLFCRHFQVDLTEAVRKEQHQYVNFNDFFTRKLDEGVRPIAAEADILTSPADGQLTARGGINARTLIQAKGREYTLSQLLTDESQAQQFSNGSFLTVYLSPRDYHRVHMPYTGVLQSMRYVPGKLFPVNEQSANRVDSLFTRNERVICYFHTDRGPMAVILVAALLVGQISTTWMPNINLGHPAAHKDFHYETPLTLEKGEEMGYFSMGSTVIVLLADSSLQWLEDCSADVAAVQMGAGIARIIG